MTAVYLLFPFSSNASADKNAANKQKRNSKTQALPDYDRFTATAPQRADNLAERPLTAAKAMNQYEPRLNVPTFLWAQKQQTAVNFKKGALKKDDLAKAAKYYVGEYAAEYRLAKADLLDATVAAVHDTGKGAIIVKLKQHINGVEVFRDELNVVMNRNLELVALSGYLTGAGSAENSFAGQGFDLSPEQAIARAAADLTGSEVNAAFLQPSENKSASSVTAASQNDYLIYHADRAALKDFTFASNSPLRVKKVFYHLADGFVPAYYVEANVISEQGANAADLYYSYVISATDGEILFRHNLTAHAEFSYRVWADPSSKMPYDGPQGDGATPYPTSVPSGYKPPYAAQNLVTLQNFPFSRGDAWLPDGATETVGNNADAYADVAAPDGFGAGDVRASVTAPGVFDYSFEPSAPRMDAMQRNMAITQLFYNVNFLHDWFYDAGFDEAAGNAQADNYGRGGAGNDRMLAEAQDYSGRNNANMRTPADGAAPRMQMYVFSAIAENYLMVNSPASIAGKKQVGISNTFGPQVFDVTGDVVSAADGTAPTGDVCEPVVNIAELAGKIALIDRGACDFTVKVLNAQNAGAVAVIIADNVPGAPAGLGGTESGITIPAMRVSQADGNNIKNALTSGSVNVRLLRAPYPGDLDGTVDNQIVAHEWGHYISNRLIGNANGLVNPQGRGMGEGWGDFHSLMMTVRPEDVNIPGNSNWSGVYGMAGYATGNGESESYYYGIRRVPYSTDVTKNALTFKHITDGVALPNTAPIRAGGVNSEVHNVGEVWATMLWECYASLLNAHPFAEAQDRMKYYLTAGYKTTPNSPTFVEARNAVLAAAFANDPADGQRFAAAFAKRGLGVGAVAPDRGSDNNAGAIESSNTGGDLAFVGASLTVTSGDGDVYLDNNETGTLNFSIKNTGFKSLSNTVAIISSDNPHISFPDGATVNIAGSQPFAANVNDSVKVAASGMTGIESVKFTITVNDSAITYGSPAPGVFSARLNASEKTGTSATDRVETESTAWTVGGDASLDASNSGKWVRTRPNGGVTNQLWYGADLAILSDQYLISPELIIGASGTFTMAFDHSYDFEIDDAANYDGGVIEMSVNGGAWTDINDSVYNGTLIDSAEGQNPLRGRKAFVGSSGGVINTQVSPPPALAQALAPGSIVKVRFRIGSDLYVGAGGWQVDNIAFTGITNTPFAEVVPHVLAPPTAANVFVSGRVLTRNNTGVARAMVSLTDADGNTRIARTNVFGYFRFDDLEIGKSYAVSVVAKQIKFAPQVISPVENLSEVNFIAEP